MENPRQTSGDHVHPSGVHDLYNPTFKFEKVKLKMLNNAVEKENYFADDERTLISKFLKKILKELDLIDQNK